MKPPLVIIAVDGDVAGVVVLGMSETAVRPIVESADVAACDLSALMVEIADWHGRRGGLWTSPSEAEAEQVRRICGADDRGQLLGAGAAALAPLGRPLRPGGLRLKSGRSAYQRAWASALRMKVGMRWQPPPEKTT